MIETWRVSAESSSFQLHSGFTLNQSKSSLLILSSSCSPVLSDASGDKLSPSGTIAGSLDRVTPTHTHHLQIFFQCISVSFNVLYGLPSSNSPGVSPFYKPV